MTATQKQVLAAMFASNKPSFDMFDLAVSPSELDKLAKAGAICGNHRNGFVLSVKGAKIASRI